MIGVGHVVVSRTPSGRAASATRPDPGILSSATMASFVAFAVGSEAAAPVAVIKQSTSLPIIVTPFLDIHIRANLDEQTAKKMTPRVAVRAILTSAKRQAELIACGCIDFLESSGFVTRIPVATFGKALGAIGLPPRREQTLPKL